LIALCLLAPAAFAGQDRTLILQAEYRRDSVDYDERVRDFTREKIFLALNRDCFLHFARIAVHHDHEQRFTWNLVMKDAPEGMCLYAGNYAVNFGSGMAVGKKRYVSPDPFTGKLVVSRDRAFSAVKSGNPAGSFSGLACGYSIPRPDFTISINFFASVRERCAPADECESGRLKSSLNTLAMRVVSPPDYTGHVYIRDFGLMTEFSLWGCADMQVYACHTWISGTGMRRMLADWDGERGDRSVSCYGIFFQYSDDCIRFFIECARPVRRLINIEGSEITTGDWGCTGGVKFRHPVVISAVTAKAAGRDFFAPHASGEQYPERAWDFTNIFIFSGKLRSGVALSGEKRMVPARCNDEIPSERRESVLIRYRLKRGGGVNLDIGRVTSEENGDSLQRKRARAGIKLRVSEHVRASVSTRVQEDTSGARSYRAGAALTVESSCLQARVDCSGYYIGGRNYIYTRVFPMRDSVTPGCFVKETCCVFTARLTLSLDQVLLSCRAQLCRNSSGFAEKRLELLGRGSW